MFLFYINSILNSQITVRSSPIIKKVDKLSICRHCHKNCKQKAGHSKTSSLKVQHSQSSSSRCCASTNSSQGSGKSTPSYTSTSRSTEQSPKESNQSAKNDDNLRDKNRSCEGSPSSQKTITTTTCSNSNALNNNVLCKCSCTAADFQSTVRTEHEIRKEKCKIINTVADMQKIKYNWLHGTCQTKPIRESKIQNLNENEFVVSTSEISNVDDWSNKLLLGLSQFRPVPSVAQEQEDDPFKAVPRISVVPPTPPNDGITNAQRLGQAQPWERLSSEQSEDSPLEELPYRNFSNTLKRYGTVSSLEKMPSDETDDKNGNSSDAETNDEDEENNGNFCF